jgi:hypothetical protein
MNYRKRLEQLEDEIHAEFSELLKQRPIFEITKEEDLDNWEVDEIFEIRNDTTGKVFDVHIIYVKQTGAILTVDTEDYSSFKTVRFSDLSSVRDKINLVEILENL